jgi:hypothetical protein
MWQGSSFRPCRVMQVHLLHAVCSGPGHAVPGESAHSDMCGGAVFEGVGASGIVGARRTPAVQTEVRDRKEKILGMMDVRSSGYEDRL